MKELSIIEKRGQLYADSRDVARIIGQRHRDLMRTIRHYADVLGAGGERKIAQSDFFVPSTYKNSQNKEMPYFMITRKGCDMIAHKLTGDKGIWFTAAYIDRFYEYEQAVKERSAPLWQLARTEGKKTRRMETDAIKMFVAYAEAQGSKNPGKYYVNFTKLANQVAGVEAGDRDARSAAQLLDLRTVETVIDHAILAEIAAGTEYHQAFRNVKVKVLQVAALALSTGYALPRKTA